MGFFKTKQEKAEQRGFRRIVQKRTTQVARQEYIKEAEKVARERGKARARKPSGFSTFGKGLLNVAGRVTAPRKAAPVRRTTRRVIKRTPVVRRRKRRTTPVKRTVRRRKRRTTPVRRRAAPQQRPPQTLDQAIYG